MAERKEYAASADSARLEAISIVRAMKNGVDFTDVFTISPKTQRELDERCKQFPEYAYVIVHALHYRELVQEHIDRICKQGLVEETPIEDVEPGDEEGIDTPAASPAAEANGWSTSGEEEHSISEAEA